jgi:hypothetical protein
VPEKLEALKRNLKVAEMRAQGAAPMPDGDLSVRRALYTRWLLVATLANISATAHLAQGSAINGSLAPRHAAD